MLLNESRGHCTIARVSRSAFNHCHAPEAFGPPRLWPTTLQQLRCPGQRRHTRPCVPMSSLPRWRNSAGGAMRLTCFSMSARISSGVIADSLGWAPSYAIGRAPGCSPSLGSVVDRAIRVPYLRQHLFRAFDMVLGILLCVCVAPCRAHELVHLVGLHRAHDALRLSWAAGKPRCEERRSGRRGGTLRCAHTLARNG